MQFMQRICLSIYEKKKKDVYVSQVKRISCIKKKKERTEDLSLCTQGHSSKY